MSGREYAQLKRMLECQNVQERPLGAGQQVFIGAPKRKELLAHETATLGVIGDLLDERHVSRFESHLFDHNSHLNVHIYALE
jgi:hypothetical protein